MSVRKYTSSLHHLRFAFVCVALCVIAGSMASPAAAQERFAGQWIIASAVRAPWADEPNDPANETDAKRLIGKQMTISANVFRAPAPLGCAKPTYVLHNRTADMLFEGGLNADGDKKPTDPAVVARSLGITSKTMQAMTASCSEVEFVLIDPDTMLFGLNDRVFTVKRVK